MLHPFSKRRSLDDIPGLFRIRLEIIQFPEISSFVIDDFEIPLAIIVDLFLFALLYLAQSLEDICRGNKVAIPRYDFVEATSSHDLDGNLKPGRAPVEIEPADIIFVEGNFPFLLDEIAHLIGLKVVYLTDDEIRLKRKWKRDMDYRRKYEPIYFLNRYFREQFLMADECYLPQMQMCDMIVDTTGAALWVTPEIAKILNQG